MSPRHCLQLLGLAGTLEGAWSLKAALDHPACFSWHRSTLGAALHRAFCPWERLGVWKVQGWKVQVLESSDPGKFRSWKVQVLEGSGLEGSDPGKFRSWKFQGWKVQVLEGSGADGSCLLLPLQMKEMFAPLTELAMLYSHSCLNPPSGKKHLCISSSILGGEHRLCTTCSVNNMWHMK